MYYHTYYKLKYNNNIIVDDSSILRRTMFFTTEVINIEDGSFTMVFVHDAMRLELQSFTPQPVLLPIEDKGSIDLGYYRLRLSWDQKGFVFDIGDAEREGGALYFRVPMTPELMASFKTAVDEWNDLVTQHLDLLEEAKRSRDDEISQRVHQNRQDLVYFTQSDGYDVEDNNYFMQ